MSWAAARSDLKTRLDGLELDAPYSETLQMYEYPLAGAIGVEMLPCGYISLPARSVSWVPMMRRTAFTPLVRVILGALGAPDLEDLTVRYEAWVERIAAMFDESLVVGGHVVTSVDFNPPIAFEQHQGLWGFDIGVGLPGMYEAKSLRAAPEPAPGP